MKKLKSSSKKKEYNNIFMKSIISQKIVIDFKKINEDLNNLFEIELKKKNEGKCINEGYIKNNSIQILTYSSGELFSDKIVFDVVFECLVANPVEATIIKCVAKSLTKVGIRAEIESEEMTSPLVIFLARDHHYNNELFSKVKENDNLMVKVIGQRYELNDKYISVIAELVEINNYDTVKSELKNSLQEGGEKIKIKIKKSKS
jgi:DNA-directed RNA polymerase subunit E'/Rpb7